MAQFILLTRVSAQSLHQPKSFETLVRSYGHAHTEVWPATPWAEFKKMVHELPASA